MNSLATRLLDTARRLPVHPAVVTDDRIVGYGAFADRVRQIAAALDKRFARSSTPAALICLPQGPDAYAAMFATLMAGGFYVPLNVAAPAGRIAAIVERIKPAVFITDTEWQDLLPTVAATPILSLHSLDQSRLPEPRPPHRLAYVMFTSGSTGVPKGVMISQEALAHYVEWIGASIRPAPEDRWSQHPNIAFDLSVLDIFGALLSGATLYPLRGDRARLLPAQWIRKHRLTIWNSVPSVVSLMMRASQVNAELLASVRLFTFCGEPLLPGHVDALFSAVPDAIIQNTYGPTEATVSCTQLTLTRDNWRSRARSSIALGEAVPGMTLSLDGPEAPLRGELVIAGPQLADGYWNDPGQSDAAFRTVGAGETARRAYHTGDIAEMSGDDLYFQARRDRQVKINGHRVELDDVGAALRQCGYADSAVAMIGGSLHGFVEVAADENFDSGTLKTAMLKIIDAYAVPTHFHAWPRLPRNANDKLDVQAMADAVTGQSREKAR